MNIPMQCPGEEVLLAFLDGALPPAEKAAVDAHLGTCAACSQLFAIAIDDAFVDRPQPRAPVEPEGPVSLESGGKVGRYLILAPVGAGGMGVVYSAYDPELGRQVALKLLRPEQDERGEARGRLLREAQAMARLSHPNVVAVYDAGTFGNQVFIAMELVEGGTLSEWRTLRQRSWREVAGVFLKAGQGLAAAHEAGLVHRDFKPENVLFGDDGRVRVTDFGLARFAKGERTSETDPLITRSEAPGPIRPLSQALSTSQPPPSALHSPITQTGTLIGSPAYMSPEQMLSGSADARSDIFSFCVALFEGVCGTRPFAGGTLAELRANIEAGRVRELPREVPLFLRRLLARGLRLRPEERYQSMKALLADLEQGTATRSRPSWALVALFGLVAAAALVYFAVDARRRDPARLCPKQEAQVEGSWNPARRAALEKIFLSHPNPVFKENLRATERALDSYSASWVAMSAEACRASRVRHEQSEELLALRNRCLAQRLGEMSALLDVLSKADDKTLARASGAVASLTPLSTCANTLLLEASEQPPPGQETAPRLREADRRLFEARALNGAAAYQKSLDLLPEVVATARELHFAALEAEALFVQGQDEGHLGHAGKSEELLREAVVAAELGRRDDLATRALCQLIYVSGIDLGHLDQALLWAHYAELAAERAGGGPDLEEWREQQVGSVLSQNGRAREALPHLRHALALAEQNLSPDAPENGVVVEALAVGLALDRQYEQSLPLFGRALKLNEKLVRPDHPRIGEALSNIGEVQMLAGHPPAESDEPLRRALAIFQGAFGEDHQQTANARLLIARMLRLEGKPAEALPLAQRSDDFCKPAGHCDASIAAGAAHEVGAALLELGKPQEAREALLRAVAAREKLADPELAGSQLLLAQALWADPRAHAQALELAHTAQASFAANHELKQAALASAFLDQHGALLGAPLR